MSQLNSSNYSETLIAKLFFGFNNKGKINFSDITRFRDEKKLDYLNDQQMADYILLLFLIIYGFSDLLLFDNINPLYPYNPIQQLKTISFLDKKNLEKWKQIPFTYRYVLFLTIFSNNLTLHHKAVLYDEAERSRPMDGGVAAAAAASATMYGPVPPPSAEELPPTSCAALSLPELRNEPEESNPELEKIFNQKKLEREKELQKLTKNTTNYTDETLKDFLKQYEYQGNQVSDEDPRKLKIVTKSLLSSLTIQSITEIYNQIIEAKKSGNKKELLRIYFNLKKNPITPEEKERDKGIQDSISEIQEEKAKVSKEIIKIKKDIDDTSDDSQIQHLNSILNDAEEKLKQLNEYDLLEHKRDTTYREKYNQFLINLLITGKNALTLSEIQEKDENQSKTPIDEPIFTRQQASITHNNESFKTKLNELKHSNEDSKEEQQYDRIDIKNKYYLNFEIINLLSNFFLLESCSINDFNSINSKKHIDFENALKETEVKIDSSNMPNISERSEVASQASESTEDNHPDSGSVFTLRSDLNISQPDRKSSYWITYFEKNQLEENSKFNEFCGISLNPFFYEILNEFAINPKLKKIIESSGEESSSLEPTCTSLEAPEGGAPPGSGAPRPGSLSEVSSESLGMRRAPYGDSDSGSDLGSARYGRRAADSDSETSSLYGHRLASMSNLSSLPASERYESQSIGPLDDQSLLSSRQGSEAPPVRPGLTSDQWNTPNIPTNPHNEILFNKKLNTLIKFIKDKLIISINNFSTINSYEKLKREEILANITEKFGKYENRLFIPEDFYMSLKPKIKSDPNIIINFILSTNQVLTSIIDIKLWENWSKYININNKEYLQIILENTYRIAEEKEEYSTITLPISNYNYRNQFAASLSGNQNKTFNTDEILKNSRLVEFTITENNKNGISYSEISYKDIKKPPTLSDQDNYHLITNPDEITDVLERLKQNNEQRIQNSRNARLSHMAFRGGGVFFNDKKFLIYSNMLQSFFSEDIEHLSPLNIYKCILVLLKLLEFFFINKRKLIQNFILNNYNTFKEQVQNNDYSNLFFKLSQFLENRSYHELIENMKYSFNFIREGYLLLAGIQNNEDPSQDNPKFLACLNLLIKINEALDLNQLNLNMDELIFNINKLDIWKTLNNDEPTQSPESISDLINIINGNEKIFKQKGVSSGQSPIFTSCAAASVEPTIASCGAARTELEPPPPPAAEELQESLEPPEDSPPPIRRSNTMGGSLNNDPMTSRWLNLINQ